MLEPIEIFGVDRFAESEVGIKARLKTLPLQQWSIGREYRRRPRKAFEVEKIEIPFPHSRSLSAKRRPRCQSRCGTPVSAHREREEIRGAENAKAARRSPDTAGHAGREAPAPADRLSERPTTFRRGDGRPLATSRSGSPATRRPARPSAPAHLVLSGRAGPPLRGSPRPAPPLWPQERSATPRGSGGHSPGRARGHLLRGLRLGRGVPMGAQRHGAAGRRHPDRTATGVREGSAPTRRPGAEEIVAYARCHPVAFRWIARWLGWTVASSGELQVVGPPPPVFAFRPTSEPSEPLWLASTTGGTRSSDGLLGCHWA